MESRRYVCARRALVALAVLAFLAPSAVRAQTGSITQCLFVAPRYDITWRPGFSPVTATLEVPSSQIIAKDAAMRAQGWQVDQIHTNVYSCPNNPTTATFDVQWRQTWAPEDVLYWLSLNTFLAKQKELIPQGWRLSTMDAFVFDGTVYYNAVWHQGTWGQYDYLGLSPSDITSQFLYFNSYGWSASVLDTYRLSDGSVHYNVSWRQLGSGGMYFLATPTQFADKDAELHAQGFNVTTMSITGGTSPLYSVSWLPLYQQEEKSKGLQDYQVLSTIASRQAAGWTIATFEGY
jgi:Bacterial tandem repeat domain 1